MHALYTISFSHYCEKARWALDYVGERYREQGFPPGLHFVATVPRGGRSTPLLVTRGGRTLTDSSEIVAFAESCSPGALLPLEREARDEVLALEEELDEKVGPHVRRLAYFAMFEDGGVEVLERLIRRSTTGLQRRAAPILARGAKALVTRGLRVDAAGAERSRAALMPALDRLDARLGDGRPFVAGERFTAADITLGALLAAAVRPPEHPITGPLADEVRDAPRLDALRDEIRARPSGQLALRLYRDHRRARVGTP